MNPLVLKLSICALWLAVMTAAMMPVATPFPAMHIDLNRMFVR